MFISIKTLYWRRFVCCWVAICFVINSIPMAQAQDFRLPAPGVMVRLSPEFNPPILKGLKVHPDNPFKFDFILDTGDSGLSVETPLMASLRNESTKLIKYFLATLTIPEKDLWVNLSPYEKNRIIPSSFGLTTMGRDLLAEDYMLKQITASLIYPEDTIGKKFWKRIYEEAAKKFGTTNIPVNTFNKVWIVPEKAVVYENAKEGTAYVVESTLKVMLEQDYLSLQKHEGIQSQDGRDAINGVSTNQLGSQIVREIVIPELTKEVNEGKNFYQLRQVYNSLILATWYKKKIKDSILEQVYAGKKKVAGVSIDDPKETQKIYQRYLKAFKKGVYNFIKEDVDPVTQETIPRKYFSGGTEFDDNAMNAAMSVTKNPSVINFSGSLIKRFLVLAVGLTVFQALATAQSLPTTVPQIPATKQVEPTPVDLGTIEKEYQGAIAADDLIAVNQVLIDAHHLRNPEQAQFDIKVSHINARGIAHDALKSLRDLISSTKLRLSKDQVNDLKDIRNIWKSHGVGTCVRTIDEILRLNDGVVDNEADLKTGINNILNTLKNTTGQDLSLDLIDEKLWEAEDLFFRLEKINPVQAVPFSRKDFVDGLNNIFISKGYYIFQWSGFNFDRDDNLFILFHIEKRVMVTTDQGIFPIYLSEQKTQMFNDSTISVDGWSYPDLGFGIVNLEGSKTSDYNEIAPVLEGGKPFLPIDSPSLIQVYKDLINRAFQGKTLDERLAIVKSKLIAHEADHLRLGKIKQSAGNAEGQSDHYGAEETLVLLHTLSNPNVEPFHELARMVKSSELKPIKDALLALTNTNDVNAMYLWLDDMASPVITADMIRKIAGTAADKYGREVWKPSKKISTTMPNTTYKVDFNPAMTVRLNVLGKYDKSRPRQIINGSGQVFTKDHAMQSKQLLAGRSLKTIGFVGTFLLMVSAAFGQTKEFNKLYHQDKRANNSNKTLAEDQKELSTNLNIMFNNVRTAFGDIVPDQLKAPQLKKITQEAETFSEFTGDIAKVLGPLAVQYENNPKKMAPEQIERLKELEKEVASWDYLYWSFNVRFDKNVRETMKAGMNPYYLSNSIVGNQWEGMIRTAVCDGYCQEGAATFFDEGFPEGTVSLMQVTKNAEGENMMVGPERHISLLIHMPGDSEFWDLAQPQAVAQGEGIWPAVNRVKHQAVSVPDGKGGWKIVTSDGNNLDKITGFTFHEIFELNQIQNQIVDLQMILKTVSESANNNFVSVDPEFNGKRLDDMQVSLDHLYQNTTVKTHEYLYSTILDLYKGLRRTRIDVDNQQAQQALENEDLEKALGLFNHVLDEINSTPLVDEDLRNMKINVEGNIKLINSLQKMGIANPTISWPKIYSAFGLVAFLLVKRTLGKKPAVTGVPAVKKVPNSSAVPGIVIPTVSDKEKGIQQFEVLMKEFHRGNAWGDFIEPIRSLPLKELLSMMQKKYNTKYFSTLFEAFFKRIHQVPDDDLGTMGPGFYRSIAERILNESRGIKTDPTKEFDHFLTLLDLYWEHDFELMTGFKTTNGVLSKPFVYRSGLTVAYATGLSDEFAKLFDMWRIRIQESHLTTLTLENVKKIAADMLNDIRSGKIAIPKEQLRTQTKISLTKRVIASINNGLQATVEKKNPDMVNPKVEVEMIKGGVTLFITSQVNGRYITTVTPISKATFALTWLIPAIVRTVGNKARGSADQAMTGRVHFVLNFHRTMSRYAEVLKTRVQGADIIMIEESGILYASNQKHYMNEDYNRVSRGELAPEALFRIPGVNWLMPEAARAAFEAIYRSGKKVFGINRSPEYAKLEVLFSKTSDLFNVALSKGDIGKAIDIYKQLIDIQGKLFASMDKQTVDQIRAIRQSSPDKKILVIRGVSHTSPFILLRKGDNADTVTREILKPEGEPFVFTLDDSLKRRTTFRILNINPLVNGRAITDAEYISAMASVMMLNTATDQQKADIKFSLLNKLARKVNRQLLDDFGARYKGNHDLDLEAYKNLIRNWILENNLATGYELVQIFGADWAMRELPIPLANPMHTLYGETIVGKGYQGPTPINTKMIRPLRDGSITPQAKEKWVKSFSPEMQPAAQFIVDNIQYIPQEEFEGALSRSVNAFTREIKNRPFAVVDYHKGGEFDQGGDYKSNGWVLGIAKELGLPKPKEEIKVVGGNFDIKDLRNFVQKHPDIKDLVYIDDMSFSGVQIYEVFNEFIRGGWVRRSVLGDKIFDWLIDNDYFEERLKDLTPEEKLTFATSAHPKTLTGPMKDKLKNAYPDQYPGIITALQEVNRSFLDGIKVHIVIPYITSGNWVVDDRNNFKVYQHVTVSTISELIKKANLDAQTRDYVRMIIPSYVDLEDERNYVLTYLQHKISDNFAIHDRRLIPDIEPPYKRGYIDWFLKNLPPAEPIQKGQPKTLEEYLQGLTDYSSEMQKMDDQSGIQGGSGDGTEHVKMRDSSGKVWLAKFYRPDRLHRALADQLVAQLSAKLGLSTTMESKIGRLGNRIFSFVAWQDGTMPLNSLMPDNMTNTKDNIDGFLNKLYKSELKQIIKEQVLDWLVSNHDANAINFLRNGGGGLLAIDKTQAFKYIGQKDEKLSTDYNPNAPFNGADNVAYMPIYNLVVPAIKEGRLELSEKPSKRLSKQEAWEAVDEIIQEVEDINDDEYRQMLEDYANFRFNIINSKEDQKSGLDRDTFMTLAFKRKKNLRQDFRNLYGLNAAMKATEGQAMTVENRENPAMNAKGGIDLTPANMNLQTKVMDSRFRGNDSEGIKFHLDPAQLAQLQNAPGFVPVIIDVEPLGDLRRFLGVDSPPNLTPQTISS